MGQTFRAFKHRNYRIFYMGQAVSLTGTWMQTIAQSWLVLELTDSKAQLGFVTMLQFLPITLFVLPAGVLADRVSKRELLMATRLLAMVQSILLAVLVASGQVEYWHVCILALVLGVANAFEQPTRQAFIVEMAGKDDLMNAVALNSGLFNATRLVGPALGGILIAAFGVEVAFFINAVSFVPTIWALLAMNMGELFTSEIRRGANVLADLREGLSYVYRSPPTLLVVIMAVFIGMFGFNFIVALPLISKYVLDGGAAELGFLTAALGLGAVISALVIAGRSRISRRTIFVGGTAFSVLLAGVAASEIFPLTIVLLFFLGVALTSFAATANTTMQLSTPDHLRGRVMGLWMLLFAGSTPFGGYLTGFMSEHLGVQTAITFNAAMCGLGVAAGLLYYTTHRRQIREADEQARVAATLVAA
jgi:MFS family permease